MKKTFAFGLLLLMLCVVSQKQRLFVSGESEHCENLNQTIIIEETVVDSEVKDLIWLMNSTKIVFARTDEGVLYLSQDEGKTWVNQMPLLIAARGSQNPGDFKVEAVFPVSSTKAYIAGSHGNLWTTDSRGQSYIYRGFAKHFLQLQPDTWNGDWALGLVPSSRCINSSLPGYCFYSLYVTQDFGASWYLVDTYVRMFAWGLYGKIFYDTLPTKTGNQYSADPIAYYLYNTPDWGYSKTFLMDNCGGVVMKGGTLFTVQKVREGDLRLFISRNYGEGPLLDAKLPTLLRESRYTILETGSDYIFINVEHDSEDWGHLYVSGVNDTQFVLSLERNKRSVTGHCDFTNLPRLRGIYIANYYPDPETRVVRTVISFNKGGSWQPLTPPKTDVDGKPIFCAQGCSLHLHSIHREGHMFSDDDGLPFGPVYSTHNAVGLIIATGNVGLSLSSNAGDIGTYFSRDAGVTWTQIAKGSHVYDFADHGALVVTANNLRETADIMFSLNQHTFSTCHFTNPLAELEVQDIRAEPSNTESTFVLSGIRDENGVRKGILVFMDFTKVYPRQCDPNLDYEEWSPTDSTGRNCYMGITETFTRRKQDSECFNGNDYETRQKKQICPCAQQDYECDFCFAPYEGKEGVCLQFCNDTVMQPPDCVDYYYISRGYRLIQGDVCNATSGLDLRPIKKACENVPQPEPDHKASNNKSKKIITAVSIVLTFGALVLCCGGLLIFAIRNPRANAVIASHLPTDRYRNIGFIKLQTDTAPLDEPDMTEAEEISDTAIMRASKTEQT